MATPESAAAFLMNDDVSVTNASDKVKQLAKVSGLDERVRDVMVRNAAIGKVHDATRAEPVDTAALRASVEEAQAVGVEDENLEGARRALRASADRQCDLAGGGAARRGAVPARCTRGATRRDSDSHDACWSERNGRTSLRLHAARAQGGGVRGGLHGCWVHVHGGQKRRAGYGADKAKAAGFIRTIEEAKAVGCVEGLRAAGFTCQEARLASNTCTEARRACYMCWEVKQVGYTWEEGRQAGYTCAEVTQVGYARLAGYTLQEARETRLEEAMMHAGYTWEDVRQAGCMLEEVRQACAEVKQVGYTWEEVRQAGYTLKEARQAGCTCAELRQAGYTWRGGEAGVLHVCGGEAGRLHVSGGVAGGLHCELAELVQ